MGDTESFSSLMDLVNSHLSKTSLNTSQSGDEGSSTFRLPSIHIQSGMAQTVFTPPSGIMAIPRLGPQDNEITEVLAHQVSNMLIAKKKKKQEDDKKQRLKEEIKLLKHQKPAENYEIDLMSSIISPNLDQMITQPMPDAKRAGPSRSIESVSAEVKALDPLDSKIKLKKPFLPLPLNQDMSYMLFRKVKRGKSSAFGRVISARVKPVAAPYMKVEVKNAMVQRFHFSTQSPCDKNLQKRRHPRDPYSHMNMVEHFMAQTHNEGCTYK